jgi:geranylgeranyl pyrophosphate synthase
VNASGYLSEYQHRIDHALITRLPDVLSEPRQLHQAMHYSVLNGGKRLRPLLVYATSETLELPLEQLDSTACAVELIHAYSLIHDDLPALDNDDFRRGQPSCHKAFNEATAILTGDALQTLAFEILARENSSPTECLGRINILANACRAMVSGQAMELALAQDERDINKLENIHALKTGALIHASVQLGALTAQLSAIQEQALDDYARCAGLAFQIRDDIEDNHAQITQQNYVTYLGLPTAQARLSTLQQQALAAIDIFGTAATPLRTLLAYMLD